MVYIDPNEKDVEIEKNFFSEDVPVEKRTAVLNGKEFAYNQLLHIHAIRSTENEKHKKTLTSRR